MVGADAEEGADILPDRIVNLADGEGFPEADPDGMEFTDLDNEATDNGELRPEEDR